MCEDKVGCAREVQAGSQVEAAVLATRVPDIRTTSVVLAWAASEDEADALAGRDPDVTTSL